MTITSKFIAAGIAASMVISPIAAQANTRAGDSGSVYAGAVSQPGLGREADGENLVGVPGIIAAIIAGAGIIAAIIIIEDDDNQSPGGN